MSEERARKAAKGWLTRAGKKLQDLLSVPADNRKSEWRLEASSALTEFSKRLDAFDVAQTAVEAVIDEDSLYDDIEKSGLFRDEQIGHQVRLSLAVSDAQAVSESDGTQAAKVNLPKLNLPDFDGRVDKWLYFWESFDACVNQSTIPEVQKFSYLRALLKGEAARSVAGLKVAASSYVPAIEILKQRYGRPEKQIFHHVQGLLNPEGSDLGALQDSLMAHIRSLESLGVDRDSYGVVLTPLVLSKLPEDVRLEWARTSEGKEGDLTHLLTFLNEEISRRERSGHCMELAGTPAAGPALAGTGATPRRSSRRSPEARGPAVPATSSSSRISRIHDSRQPAAAALAAPTREAAAYCGFCRHQHRTDRCPDWLKLSRRDRFQQVKVSGLCFGCLGSGHSARVCKARCSQCKGRHHVTCCLQLQNSDDVKPVSSVAVGGAGSREGFVGPNPSQGTSVVTNPAPSVSFGGEGTRRQGLEVGPHPGMGPSPPPGMSLSCNAGCTFLPTTAVYVKSLSEPVKAQLIFDSGSDRTYVSNRLMKKVSGQWKGTVEMTYAAFGGGKSCSVCNMYELELTGANLSLPVMQRIQAVEVPVISAPLMRPTWRLTSFSPSAMWRWLTTSRLRPHSRSTS